jgi:hypothetical protein
MRFTWDHLIFKALCALDEAVEVSRARPVEPSHALQFALAYLYTVSVKQERHHYDQFWRIVQGKGDSPANPANDYRRGTYACSCLQAICRSVGMEYTASFAKAMRDGRQGALPIRKPTRS